ncbi:MAG: acetoacetate--CoA ligase [Bauldia litoralis]
MTTQTAPEAPIWTPSPERIAGTNMAAFVDFVREQKGIDLPDYDTLWRWSVDSMEDFWCAFWDFTDILADTRGDRVLVDGDDQLTARFFPDARLNFAENMLRRSDDGEAIVFRNERGDSRRLSWAELTGEVARLAKAFLADGIEPGDRVAAYMPNIPETAIVMLAATAVGATFSSCAPDFGVRGVLDRFGQIEPTVLVAADGYHYNGRTHRVSDRVAEVVAGLPGLKRVLLVPYIDPEPDLDAVPGAVGYADYLAPHSPDAVPYKRLPFDQPLFILFSSGTTGAPKCIVHRAGGTLLQSIKEPLLHLDARRDDRVLFFTSTTWVVWNLHITFLDCGTTILLYDGSPFYPGPDALFDYMERERATHFGTSAKFIDAIKQAGIAPGRERDLSALRVILTSGSALLPECFDYIYDSIKSDLQLSSISGGTDIMCGFLSGNPIGPVWRGELQAPALGMAVEVWDDDGKPLGPGEKGELVCTKPHPSIPLKFMGDPDDSRRRAAYFEHFPGVWRHGDLMEWSGHDNGCVIYGRSDATLNPGGVRIGTAEIYRPVEQLDEVVEALAVGQDWPPDSRIVLFVVLREGLTLDDALREKIKGAIRAGATPRHVPARIAQVPDIPRTKTGKIVELAVREVVHGRPVKNIDALANPEALDSFAGREELAV